MTTIKNQQTNKNSSDCGCGTKNENSSQSSKSQILPKKPVDKSLSK